MIVGSKVDSASSVGELLKVTMSGPGFNHQQSFD